MHAVCTSIEKPAYAGRYEWYTEYVPVWGGARTTNHNQCAFCPGWQLFSSLRARATALYRSWRGNAVVASFCRSLQCRGVQHSGGNFADKCSIYLFYFLRENMTLGVGDHFGLHRATERTTLNSESKSPLRRGWEGSAPPWRGFLGLINFNIYTRTIFLSVTEIKEIFDDYFIFYN